MRGSRAITGLLALVAAAVVACGGGGGSDSTTITVRSGFPQGFLPVLLPTAPGCTACGDVAFRAEGDLFAVDGGPDVTIVSRTDGSVRTFVHVSGASLRSIAVGVGNDASLYAGGDDGRIWKIAFDGSSAAPLVGVDTGSQPITGLAFAPSGFGDFGGSLFAAAGSDGIARITVGTIDPPTAPADAPFTGGNYVDLAFSGTTLFALDDVDDEIDTVDATGAATTFRGGFAEPVGIAVDTTASEIYVADTGNDVISTVPVGNGAPTQRASYHFDSASAGVAYDGIGAVAFITSSPHAIRLSDLPRIDPANTSFRQLFADPDKGFGDLELDKLGAFVLVANATDPANHFLFSVPRNPTEVVTLSSEVADPTEQLIGVAIDPFAEDIYYSSSKGFVYKRNKAGVVTPISIASSSTAVLSLEFVPRDEYSDYQVAPFDFDPFAGQLIAGTTDGHLFAIDPVSLTPTRITPVGSPIGTHLSDLVFSSNGTLYAVDNNGSSSRILEVAPNGTATVFKAASSALGLVDGIEIDEGGQRLLVTSQTSGEQLLSIDLDDKQVRALADIDIDDAFLPTGVIYDRLGTVVFRERNDATALRAIKLPLAAP